MTNGQDPRFSRRYDQRSSLSADYKAFQKPVGPRTAVSYPLISHDLISFAKL